MARVLAQFPNGHYPLGQYHAPVPSPWPGPPVPTRAPSRGWPAATRAPSRGRPAPFVLRGFGQEPGLSPTQWSYTLGHGLRGLGDDTPNSIRLYVPRLASGLHALMLYDTGLTYGAVATKPFEQHVWEPQLAREFKLQANKYLGFAPIVHELDGEVVIFAHMAGASDHDEAERIWGAMQRAITRARTATGTPAPVDPKPDAPRAWQQAVPPPPGPGPVPGPGPGPGPGPAPGMSILGFLTGAGMVIAAIIL